jgi:PIN domain nuclease of toxin-antitoxin system
MSYLLDTHILLWWLSDPKKLSTQVIDLISNPENEIFISAVSAWEIAIKKGLKKLKAPDNLKEVIDSNGFLILPIHFHHALYVEKLPNIHFDPFDRLLISQSHCEQITFITSDKIISQYKINIIGNNF